MADPPDDLDRRLREPQPSDARGMRIDGGYNRPAWTPLGFIRRGEVFLLACRACGHIGEAPLQALVDRGEGDQPMIAFRGRWTCARCKSREVEAHRSTPRG